MWKKENKMDTTANTPNAAPVSQSEKLLYSQFRRKINAEAARSQIKSWNTTWQPLKPVLTT